mgnify:CR=1 FL=1
MKESGKYENRLLSQYDIESKTNMSASFPRLSNKIRYDQQNNMSSIHNPEHNQVILI